MKKFRPFFAALVAYTTAVLVWFSWATIHGADILKDTAPNVAFSFLMLHFMLFGLVGAGMILTEEP